MSGPFIDIALVKIETLADSKRLFDVRGIDVSTTKETTAVACMNQRRVARGWTRKTKAVEATIRIALSSTPEVEWEDLLDSDEEFTISFQRGPGGQTRQLVGCIVDDVGEAYEADGEPTFDVHVMALDNVKVRGR